MPVCAGSAGRRCRSRASGRMRRMLLWGRKPSFPPYLRPRRRQRLWRSVARAPVAGRLPLRPAANDPASDQIVAAPLLAMSRHQPAAGSEGRSRREEAFQGLPDRPLPLRHCRGHNEEGKLHLYVGIDRTSKFAFAQLHEKADRSTAAVFQEASLEAVPDDPHTILTDNSIQCTDLPHNRDGWTTRMRVHRFDQICREHDIPTFPRPMDRSSE